MVYISFARNEDCGAFIVMLDHVILPLQHLIPLPRHCVLGYLERLVVDDRVIFAWLLPFLMSLCVVFDYNVRRLLVSRGNLSATSLS